MKRSLYLVVIILLLAIVAGCSPASTAQESAPEGGFNRDFGAPAPAQPAMEAPMAPDADMFNSGKGAQESTRLVIENANMTIVVAEPGQAMSEITRMAEEMGGFVVRSNLYKTTTESGIEVPQANITVRVPVERLDDALSAIRGLTENPEEDVRSENRTGEDVTESYTDLQSRLRNSEETERQLREIQASATRTEDVLNVFNQISAIREQIEVLKGQIKYYEESAALSAIDVQLMAQEAVDPLTIGGWKPEGVARDAVQALINTVKFLANALIWIVLWLLPVGLIIGVPLYLIIRAVRRRRARRAAPPVVKE